MNNIRRKPAATIGTPDAGAISACDCPTSNDSLSRVRLFNRELDRLRQYQLTGSQDLRSLVQRCTQSISAALSVERVGLWLFNDDRSAIINYDLFQQADQKHTSGDVLTAEKYPRYFAALSDCRVIDANNASLDPRTNEFEEDYLKPNDIVSMLDAQVRTAKAPRGVVCCEKIGTEHKWTPDEVSFVASVADFLGLAFESDERQRYQEMLIKANEWVLRHSENLKRFALVAERTNDAIIITNPHGQIEWVNKGFERLTEYQLADVVGKKPGSFLQGPNTSSESVAAISAALSEKKPIRLDMLNYSKSGREYWLDIRIDPILGKDGSLEYFVAIEKDVTARVIERQQLAAALEDARAAAISKSEFLATMSHEIRTPLNGVLAIGRLLQSSSIAEADREKIDLIVQSGENLLNTLNNVLDLASLEAGHQTVEEEEFSIRDVIDQAAALLSDYAAERTLTVETEVPDGVPDRVIGDSGRLAQVLFNLIGNAIKFSENGTIIVRASSQALADGEVKLTIEVEDNGIGIPAHAIPNLFEPFSQADRSITRKYGGTGLGLSICKSLCELMGGTIWVTSEENVGSTFAFTITVKPVGERQLPDVSPVILTGLTATPTPHSSQANVEPCVLVVEDNAMNQQIIKMIMEAMGMSPDCVGNGQEAIEALELKSYDIVLMDIQMPVMDGFTATKLIRQSGKPYAEVPIIAVTANTLKVDSDEFMAAGMDGFVPKPITPSVLIREIEGAFRSREKRIAVG